MVFKEGPIDGVTVRMLDRYSDDRGWLCELWRADEMKDLVTPVMCYLSSTKPGASRGPHEHVHQSDYFIFPGTSEFLVRLWDSRKGSVTCGNRTDITADRDKPLLVIVPPGVVHGYRNTGRDEGLVINLPDKLYRGKGKTRKVDEIRHENRKNSPYEF